MKKIMIMAVAAIAAMSSCTNEEVYQPTESNDAAVSFSAYQLGQSRASVEDLQSVKKNGFGVFAFSQMSEPIAKYSKNNFMPDFMYNQLVNNTDPENAGGQWTYSPIKYFPNNPGALVSFYAYAPYFVEFSESNTYTQTPETNEYLNVVNPIEKKNVRLILGYDYNGPGIEYTRPEDPTEGVDLMWGERVINGTGTGYAAIDCPKLASNDKIFFQFHHALARVNFNIQVWNDVTPGSDAEDYHPGTTTPTNNALTPFTTIYIRKVELLGNIANKGTLRLYDGTWNIEKNDHSDFVLDENDFATTIADGITGDEAIKEVDLLKGYGVEQAIANGKNPEAHEPVNNYLMLIPGATFTIQITYDVETKDPIDPKNSSVVTNVIKSTDVNALHQGSTDGVYQLKPGLAYNFHLNIGMKSVEFDADVDEWKVENNEVVLPKNE